VDPGPVRDVLTVAVGVGTGALSGLFGVGGAVVSTPGIRVLGCSALAAVGTTLPSIIPGAASGAARYWRAGLVERSTLVTVAPLGAAATILGALLAQVVPGDGHVLQLLTAALLAFSAYRMARSSDGSDDGDAERADPTEPSHQRLRLILVGLLAGTLSGLLGIGGGVVMVPGFVQLAGLSVKRAIATSLVCVAIFAVPGTITHGLVGNIDWRFALLLAVGVVPGARLGAALTIRASDRRTRVTVAAFLGVLSVVYAVGELLAL
jgi:uncharacterized membrane protein YfcA